MYRAILAMITVVALCTPGAANAQGFDVQLFQPANGPHGAFATEGARVVPHATPTGALMLNYTSRPLVLVEETDDGEELTSPIVDQQFALHGLIGVGLFDYVQLDLDVPLYIVNEGNLPQEFSKAGLGDIRLRLKAKLYAAEEGFGVALASDVGFPTGAEERYIGEGSVSVAPRLVLDYDFGPLVLMLNGGVRFREEAQFGNNLDLGTDATFGLGAELELMRGLLLVTGDLYGRTSTRDFFAGEDTPVEGLLGGKIVASHGITITGAAGGGITGGAGAAAFRMILSIGWAPREVDYDDDGILNDADSCPDDAEDIDGFQDADGCPEPDNDRDTIADGPDECPDEPEDMDGFEDEDGCPDLDNDNDQINDDADECRDEPEDVDGFADEDGCPDLDNDDDGIGDADDQCRDEAEDPDGFADDDGCPDLDNDNDKIPDAEDSCPNEAGLPEDQGCPPKETKAVREGGQIKILDKVFFETGKAAIKEESFGLLKQVALVLRTNDDIKKAEVGGHTDDRGRDAKNLELSQARADAVRQWLIDFGIAADRLVAVGYGETKPVVQGRSKEARAANRRVEFKILDPAPAQTPPKEDDIEGSPESKPKASTEDSQPESAEPKAETPEEKAKTE